MAQNTTGTANTVNPYLGGNVSTTRTNDPTGVPKGAGSGVITGDSGQMNLTHVEYRFGTTFATDTTKQSG